VTEILETASERTRLERISPVFGDIVAKMTQAADHEIDRLLSLGLPIIVDRGHGIEELTTRPSP
jgi:hypothetical protein